MGVEALMIAFYEQPELIHDIMDTLTDLWLSLYAGVVRDVRIDAIHMWEDMSGKQGSLISPAMVEEFMLPNYRKISHFARENNIPVFSVDTDGNVQELVPLFLSAGVNLVYPFEVAAGCDINTYRQLYPALGIMGGIDKQQIALGKEATDTELHRIEGVFQRSGFVPSLDHLIHPDISWTDFQYFIARLKEMIFRYAGTY
jgi:uroporphyrinogen decarboxylase